MFIYVCVKLYNITSGTVPEVLWEDMLIDLGGKIRFDGSRENGFLLLCFWYEIVCLITNHHYHHHWITWMR